VLLFVLLSQNDTLIFDSIRHNILKFNILKPMSNGSLRRLSRTFLHQFAFFSDMELENSTSFLTFLAPQGWSKDCFGRDIIGRHCPLLWTMKEKTTPCGEWSVIVQSGAAGSRTPVQTGNQYAFYMLSLSLVVGH